MNVKSEKRVENEAVEAKRGGVESGSGTVASLSTEGRHSHAMDTALFHIEVGN